jgi:hypothetical protein
MVIVTVKVKSIRQFQNFSVYGKNSFIVLSRERVLSKNIMTVTLHLKKVHLKIQYNEKK